MTPASRQSLLALLVLVMGLAAGAPAYSDDTEDCYGADNERRIRGCSALIDSAELPDDKKAVALALRGLAYSVKGQYDRALPDYDEAIRLDPQFSIALNNRAWTYYKSGRGQEGLADVERALELAPGSPHAFDTRAHIRQSMGLPAAALADYERAISYGGSRMIKLYQCGLQAHGIYDGAIDGFYTSALRRALEACIARPDCDPLPADEECRKLTS